MVLITSRQCENDLDISISAKGSGLKKYEQIKLKQSDSGFLTLTILQTQILGWPCFPNKLIAYLNDDRHSKCLDGKTCLFVFLLFFNKMICL